MTDEQESAMFHEKWTWTLSPEQYEAWLKKGDPATIAEAIAPLLKDIAKDLEYGDRVVATGINHRWTFEAFGTSVKREGTE